MEPYSTHITEFLNVAEPGTLESYTSIVAIASQDNKEEYTIYFVPREGQNPADIKHIPQEIKEQFGKFFYGISSLSPLTFIDFDYQSYIKVLNNINVFYRNYARYYKPVYVRAAKGARSFWVQDIIDATIQKINAEQEFYRSERQKARRIMAQLVDQFRRCVQDAGDGPLDNENILITCKDILLKFLDVQKRYMRLPEASVKMYEVKDMVATLKSAFERLFLPARHLQLRFLKEYNEPMKERIREMEEEMRLHVLQVESMEKAEKAPPSYYYGSQVGSQLGSKEEA